MKKFLTCLLAVCLIAGLTACLVQPETPDLPDGPIVPSDAAVAEPVNATVGISLPSNTDIYWKRSAQEMTRQLEAMGHTVIVAGADGTVEEQIRQLRDLIDRDVDCLVIAAIDSLALLKEQKVAEAKGISVIAYDRMLMDSDAVCGFVSYDFEAMGAAVARQIIAQCSLETALQEKRPQTIEFFMGSPEDNSALLFHQGLMRELLPYLESGALICRTGRTSFEDTCTSTQDEKIAYESCLERLSREYPAGDLNICCTASDSLAYSCLEALRKAGYTDENWPVITGQGGGVGAVKRIVGNTQAITVYKDPLHLAQLCSRMVNRVAYGLTPQTDNIVSNNHVLQVPTVYSPATVIHAGNYEEELIRTRIYTLRQVTPDPTESTDPTGETTADTTSGETTAATSAPETAAATTPPETTAKPQPSSPANAA